MAIKSNHNYLYGTEVPNYNYYPERIPTKEPNSTTKVLPQHNQKIDWGFSLRLFLCGALLFATTFSFVYLYSVLSSKQQQLKSLKIELREVKSEISNTSAVIAGALNLDYIKERAQTELQMSEPLPHQIVYIDFPKESYTVYGE